MTEFKGYEITRESNSNKNHHGNKVGTTGETGVHLNPFVYRECACIAHSTGGVTVVVSDYLSSEDLEPRFKTEIEALEFIAGLKENGDPSTKIPF